MSSSRRSGSVRSNSRRQSLWLRDMRCPAGPVCQTLSSQIQSKPCSARRSSSASLKSSSVVARPSACDSSVSRRRLLIWYSAG